MGMKMRSEKKEVLKGEGPHVDTWLFWAHCT